jgi:hypothetical protein
MAENETSDEDRDDTEASQPSQRPLSRRVAPWANERRFDVLTPEQIKKLCSQLVEIQRIEREIGLEQRGPSLS